MGTGINAFARPTRFRRKAKLSEEFRVVSCKTEGNRRKPERLHRRMDSLSILATTRPASTAANRAQPAPPLRIGRAQQSSNQPVLIFVARSNFRPSGRLPS